MIRYSRSLLWWKSRLAPGYFNIYELRWVCEILETIYGTMANSLGELFMRIFLMGY